MLPVVVTNMLPPPRQQALARFSALALVASLPLLYVSLLRPPPAALAGDTAFVFLMSNCVIGALFLGSSSQNNNKDHGASSSGCHDDSGLSFLPGGGGQPAAVALEEASVMASSNTVVNDGALPFSVHASVLQQRGGEEHEVAPVPPGTDKDSSNVTLEGQGVDVEDIARPASSASEDDFELPGPEPELEPEPGLVEEEEDEELPEAWAMALRSRTHDLLLQHGKRSGEEKKLRRSATEGSKPAAAEEGSEYWDLTDEELNRRVEDFIARFRRQMIEQEAGVVV